MYSISWSVHIHPMFTYLWSINSPYFNTFILLHHIGHIILSIETKRLTFIFLHFDTGTITSFL